MSEASEASEVSEVSEAKRAHPPAHPSAHPPTRPPTRPPTPHSQLCFLHHVVAKVEVGESPYRGEGGSRGEGVAEGVARANPRPPPLTKRCSPR